MQDVYSRAYLGAQEREQELERAASEALAASSAAEAEHAAEEERLCNLRQRLENLGKQVRMLDLCLASSLTSGLLVNPRANASIQESSSLLSRGQ